MAFFRFTYEGDYKSDNSDFIFSSQMAAGVRAIDFGPGTAIAGYEGFGNSLVYAFSGPGLDTVFGEVGYTTPRIGIFGDTSDFAYTARITGGDYGDVILTGAGNDVLNGGGGNDTLEGGLGSNNIDGGTGKNTLSYEHFQEYEADSEGNFYGVIVNMASNIGTDHSNRILSETFSNISNIRGSDYTDTIIGDTKNNVIEGGGFGDVLSGGDGRDTLSYQHSFDAVTIDLSTNTASNGDASGDNIQLFENLLGSAWSDILVGDTGDNVIEGGASSDSMFGGAGNDTLSYQQSSAGVTVDLLFDVGFGGDAEGDTYSSFENLIGSTSEDVLSGTDDANTLNGNGGPDELFGRRGDDRLVISASPSKVDGGADTDLLFVNAGSPVELSTTTFQNIEKVYVRDGAVLDMSSVEAGTKIFSQSVAESDTSVIGVLIVGTSGADRIQGGKGNDVMMGGKGGDSLFAGAGADTFVFTDGDGRDVIRTFDRTMDKLDVSSLAASMDDMTFRSYRGGTGIVITFEGDSAPSDKIILLDVAYQSLTEGNFLF